MTITAKGLAKIIKADGWYQVKSNSGSHRQYKHPTKKGKITIPFHSGELPPKTAKSVMQQAGLV